PLIRNSGHSLHAQIKEFQTSISARLRTNNTDGTASIVRLPKPGAKAGSIGKATGRWSIGEDGKYCLTEEWSLEAGGPIHWCSEMYRDSAGVLHRLRDAS
ncbi:MULTISPECIES: DUF995 domain-containing protein, partial [unclassified Caballeronia]|uniref:DUF995 domain-containing protein n=1 Tax=unclassified Caballeronia TaxID=2646786 RepID=UPI00202966CF